MQNRVTPRVPSRHRFGAERERTSPKGWHSLAQGKEAAGAESRAL